MKLSRPIAILTDFGLSDHFVGVLKGVILSISPDGKSLYVYRNELGETKSGDIYVSRKGNDNKFGRSKSVDEERNVNSSYFESSASVTDDGSTIYFVSDSNGSKGMADMYVSRK